MNRRRPSDPSLWQATAPDPPSCPPLQGRADTDVAIVGAGYTGLSAALDLAAAGQGVMVLEAAEPGFGCSGRNGGQVNPGSTRMLPSEVLGTLGPYWGERFLRFGDLSCDLVFDLIDRYNIDCEAIRPGYVQGAYGLRGRRTNEGWARQWGERGIAVQTLRRDEMASLTGAVGYHWGMLDPRGGSIQPLSYARGLARAAIAEGAILSGQSPVQAITRDGAGWLLHTPGGVVGCKTVILATNGYTDRLWPGLLESVVPVASFVAATKPLSHNLLASVLPGRHAVSETARVLVYYRLDAAGRFVIGGHGNWFNTREHGSHRHVRAAAVRLFPQLADVEWEYHWAGWPAMTKNRTPHLFRLDHGVYAALGYNGRGVASATAMGVQLANLVLDRCEPLLKIRPLHRFFAHRFRQVGISWHLLVGTAMDQMTK